MLRPVVVGVATAAAIGAAYLLLRQRRAKRVPVSCCPPGSLPPLSALSAGEAPACGVEKVIGGLTTYVTGGSSKARCVIVATDIWGFQAGRHRQVCDILAESLGCTVLMPDLFHGDACTPEKGPGTDKFKPWAQQWTASKVVADLDALMAHLPPSCKIGMVGFCWGTFAALLAASEGTKRTIDAACFAHPSHRKIMEVVHGMAPENVGEYYVGGIRTPTLCLAAGNDDPRCKPGGADEILIREACPTDPRFEEFATMKHGWVIKGDLADPETAQEVPRAVGLITGWLDQHLVK